jgi:hypothetical protein
MAYRKPRVIHIDDDVEGKPKRIMWPYADALVKDIKAKFNVPADKLLVLKGYKNNKILKDNDVIHLGEKGVDLKVQPDVTQGTLWKGPQRDAINLANIDYRKNRKARYLISQLLEYGEEKYRREKLTVKITEDLKYVYIPDYPLPVIWKQRKVPILIHIPESYPDSPPLGFYIPRGTCLKNGGRHDHQFSGSYYSQPDLQSLGWDWFCLHLTNSSDWQPTDDPLKPHKFWNYIDIIRLGLSYYEMR